MYRTELVEDAINKLYKLLEASNAMLATAGCMAIGVMGRFSPLPIPDSPIVVDQEKPKEDKERPKEGKDKEEVHPVTKKAVLDKLIVLLQHSERKVYSHLYFITFFFSASRS